jgi:nucleotide-binding universal stress UspA family protein
VIAASLPASGPGDVGPALVGYARQSARASLVVVGSRGLGTLKRTALAAVGLGSVSDHLVHHLDAPVVVVKAPARPPE